MYPEVRGRGTRAICSNVRHFSPHYSYIYDFLTQIARKVISVGSKITKEAMKHAPVDDRVKASVSAGADMVGEQAEADPHAGIGQRAAMGISKLH